jgi:hypothetical protein
MGSEQLACLDDTSRQTSQSLERFISLYEEFLAGNFSLSVNDRLKSYLFVSDLRLTLAKLNGINKQLQTEEFVLWAATLI